MYEFKMPSMGADMTAGTLVTWNFGVGDHVKKGDVICEIETNKGNIDVEVWEAGTIAELVIQPGAKVPVGEVLALLDNGSGAKTEQAPVPGASQPSPEPASNPITPISKPAAEPVAAPRAPTVSTTGDRILASPAARFAAQSNGLDLSTVTGSGPGGAIKLGDLEDAHHGHHRVTPLARRMADAEGVNVDDIAATGPHDTVVGADVQRAIQARSPKVTTASDAYTSLRAAIAAAMEKSKREIPHYYLKATADITETLAWLTAQNAERAAKDRLVLGALLARAVALAAQEVPEMNGFYEANAFHAAEDVHVGFAIALRGGGVVAPAIHHVQSSSLDETMQAIKDVVHRARRGKMRASEMTDPTITLTSLGELGVDTVFGIIYPPQVAIVGFGSPQEKPVAIEGAVGIHTVLDITLAGDHRVSDGLAGAKFLRLIADRLKDPEQLL